MGPPPQTPLRLSPPLSHLLSEADPGVKTGADSGASGGQKIEPGQGGLYPLNAHPDLGHIASKLLAQGQGSRVLGVGSPDLDDVVKLLGLGLKSVVKLPEVLTMAQFYRDWITDKFSNQNFISPIVF